MKISELTHDQTIDIIEKCLEKFYDCSDLDDLIICMFYLDKIDFILKNTKVLSKSELFDYEIELQDANDYAWSFL